jgi:glutamate synthase (NADPH/NADH) large chain
MSARPVRYSPERAYRPLVSPPSVEDKDACAIYASVRKDATPSHAPIALAIPALQKMLHRAGNVDGEGDGCGLLLDLPRKIWAEEVRSGGHDPSLTLHDAFAVAHIFIERSQDRERIQHDARELLGQGGFRILAERIGVVDSQALGPTAREEEPHFWQLAGLVADASRRDRVLFDLLIELEQRLGVHVPSFSATTCVYKVMGAPNILGEYYPDLRDERFETIGSFGHNRYSTNTWPSFKRVQPFSVLGHNGEINTIEQLRQEARMLGVPIQPGSSDSQDLNRTIDTLVSRDGLSLAEAMEMVVPPIFEEIRSMPADLHPFYMYLHQAMGPFAQGPVALIARHADECVFSADALGLRPLWQVETGDDYVFSSEPGVVPVGAMVSEPKPLAPGEKALVTIDRERKRSTLHPHDAMLRIVRASWLKRNGADDAAAYDRALETGGPLEGEEVPGYSDAGPEEPVKVSDRVLAGFGWQRDDVKLVQQMASNGQEPVGSLGYDGPLAALSPERQNLADYFKETVAVVTNPAIDREREMEHFSTRTIFGRRPSIDAAGEDTGTIETAFPVILGGHHGLAPLSDKTYRAIARKHRTYLLEDLWEEFRGRADVVDISLLESETTKGAIDRIKQEAAKKVRDGAELLVLTDRTVYDADRRYLDPHLATSAVDQALKSFKVEPGEENLRRRCGIVLRSAAIRNVHDTMLALGLGANGVCPYTMIEVVCVEDYESDVSNLCDALNKGIEKVISTIGIHEVRGYARQFSSIGVKPELAEIFMTEAFAASDSAGVGFTDLDQDTNERARILAGDEEAKPAKTFRFYPKVYKAAIATANGTGSYEDYSQKVRDLEQQSPISMRHIMGLKGDREPIDPTGVDAGVGHHDYPVVISSMSFGSQSEPAFRAYAEAAKAINVLCVNGEGGEIRDMYGHYRKWRGQQVASGRFGVSAEMLNSSYLAEIKIGQGAKPGEGGHLPGKKVSEKVAAARNAAPGTDLISPSNNHDLYSIEDLAELIDELKTVNPDVRVSVKVPVVPNIGTIGLGIAKAGRDLGRRRLSPRPRHRQAALPRRQPGRLRHPGDGQPRLHDLPRLPARYLPRRHRDPDRDGRAGPGARPEEVHPAGDRQRRRELRPLLPGNGRGGQAGRRLAGLRPRPGPGRPLRPARAGLPPRRGRPGAADHAAGGVPRPRADRPACCRGGRGAGRGGHGARPADSHGAQAGLRPDRFARRRHLPGSHDPQRVSAHHRRQRPRARRRARRLDRPLAHLRRRAGVKRRRPRQSRVQRRLGRRPGPRSLQRLRRLDPDRGGCPGRRRQGDAGRLGRRAEGQGGQGPTGQRLGRQVLRLRRPAWPPLRPGLG